MSADPVDWDDDPDGAPPRAVRWRRGRDGVLRAGPRLYEARQAALRATLAVVASLPDVPVVESWTLEEMQAGDRAYRKWLHGTGPALTPDQHAAKGAYQRLNRYGSAAPRVLQAHPGPTAVREILRLVGVGASLAQIAEARACQPKTVLRRLRDAGEHAVAAELRAGGV